MDSFSLISDSAYVAQVKIVFSTYLLLTAAVLILPNIYNYTSRPRSASFLYIFVQVSLKIRALCLCMHVSYNTWVEKFCKRLPWETMAVFVNYKCPFFFCSTHEILFYLVPLTVIAQKLYSLNFRVFFYMWKSVVIYFYALCVFILHSAKRILCLIRVPWFSHGRCAIVILLLDVN